ncbi:MAG: N-acetylneuraminic acid synthase [Alphaproteobacteria bacterium]|nr:N-acetylneuraminic acid synthase [Alphaproteobacteria bacterium]
MPVSFIAEVSSNHGQDLGRSLAFIDAAADAGCDAVKFQLFRIEKMFAPEILSQSPKHRARAAWELPLSFIEPIAEKCRDRKILFGCTPFYLEAVTALQPYVAFFKIASYELLYEPLLRACAESGKPVILSTGMASLDEVVRAANVLRKAGAESITLLHCVSAYPTPPEDANLKAIETIRNATGLPVGWSDHTVSPGVLLRAIHRYDASAIEFHLDLDGEGAEFAPGHCWLPQQIATLIGNVRDGFAADGHGLKVPAPSEKPDRPWRADPSDGLRPFKSVRASYRAESAA